MKMIIQGEGEHGYKPCFGRREIPYGGKIVDIPDGRIIDDEKPIVILKTVMEAVRVDNQGNKRDGR